MTILFPWNEDRDWQMITHFVRSKVIGVSSVAGVGVGWEEKGEPVLKVRNKQREKCQFSLSLMEGGKTLARPLNVRHRMFKNYLKQILHISIIILPSFPLNKRIVTEKNLMDFLQLSNEKLLKIINGSSYWHYHSYCKYWTSRWFWNDHLINPRWVGWVVYSSENEHTFPVVQGLETLAFFTKSIVLFILQHSQILHQNQKIFW